MDDPRLKEFRCRFPGNCLMNFDKDGLGPEYEIADERVYCRGKVIGDLRETPLNEIICDGHCITRYLTDPVEGPPPQPRFRVVQKHSAPVQRNDF